MDFSPLQEFFDQVYVITVENAVERQAKMVENLEQLKFTFFIGAYKKDFTLDEVIEAGVYDEEKAKRMHRFNKPMNTSQIGRAWSHRLVYEDMLEHNYEKVLVLEDNATPIKEGVNCLAATIAALPPEWELWFLDNDNKMWKGFSSWLHTQHFHVKHAFGKLKWSHRMINNMYARRSGEHLGRAGHHEVANAYGITKSAAEKLIKLQKPIAFNADQLLAYASCNRMLNAYISSTKVFTNASPAAEKLVL